MSDRSTVQSAGQALEQGFHRLDRLTDPALVLSVPSRSWLEEIAATIDAADAADVPLRGTTFTLKDNIDLAGCPTTVACPAAAYETDVSSTVAARLIAAGSLPIAKVNLDQFATGLVGTRSPYGTPINPFDPSLIPGGSSSGSGVSVATGLSTFSVGTDTAGSGRVPAAMCGIASVKPTPGRVSTSGIVPAVRSLDCPAFFARDLTIASLATDLAAGLDTSDPFSRVAPTSGSPVRRLGVLGEDRLIALGVDRVIVDGYASLLSHLDGLGYTLHEFDPTVLFEIGDQLYGGPWLTERAMVIADMISDPTDLDPTVATITTGAADYSPADVHRARYQVELLRHGVARLFTEIDALALPTVGWLVTLEEIAGDPIGANARLGRFTTFSNLASMCAVTIPMAEFASGAGLPPPSLALHGPAWADHHIIEAGLRIAGESPVGPPADWLPLAVAGAHLRGQALDHQLTSRSAVWESTVNSAPTYRLYALETVPPKPAVVHVGPVGGSPIEMDVWWLSPAAFGDFVASIAPPLGIGTVDLEDGRSIPGFIAEPRATNGAVDITRFGGWRAYRSSVG